MDNNNLKKIVNVRFREGGRIYEFYTGHFVLNQGDTVIVETDKGLDLGTVCGKPRLRYTSVQKRPIKNIFRMATPEDIEKKAKNEEIESEAMKFCHNRINKKSLPMNLISAKLPFDRKKFIFFYTSKTRVDFRELVKELVKKFHIHVEMKQIGARDMARMQGGLGHCGRRLCCSLFLSDLDPISIRMAKDQNLSLNPSKISGVCGRLMCCLAYEHEDYLKNKPDSRSKNGETE